MNSEQFVYWLNGFVETNPNAHPTGTQWQIIKDHLATVFNKVTPVRITPKPVVPAPVFPTPAIGVPYDPIFPGLQRSPFGGAEIRC